MTVLPPPNDDRVGSGSIKKLSPITVALNSTPVADPGDIAFREA